MEGDPEEISRAVILFLGFGSAPSPRQDGARLEEQFGTAHAHELQTEVTFLLKEVGAITVDWSTHTLVSAGEMVRAKMQARHPELSDTALSALEWKFTFDWR